MAAMFKDVDDRKLGIVCVNQIDYEWALKFKDIYLISVVFIQSLSIDLAFLLLFHSIVSAGKLWHVLTIWTSRKQNN